MVDPRRRHAAAVVTFDQSRANALAGVVTQLAVRSGVPRATSGLTAAPGGLWGSLRGRPVKATSLTCGHPPKRPFIVASLSRTGGADHTREGLDRIRRD